MIKIALLILLTAASVECGKKSEIVPEMVYIPPGEFLMGSKNGEGYPPENPQHTVYLDPYYIGKYEVTNREFLRFVEETGYITQVEKNGWGWVWVGKKWRRVRGANWKAPLGPGSSISDKMNHPVVQVSWFDAMAYCRWLSKVTGERYFLPTEAQWEKAARGTDGRRWPWGDEWDGTRLNFADKNTNCPWRDESVDDGYRYTAPVGNYPGGASPYGTMDMAGNVWEWCMDWYEPEYYAISPRINPTGPENGSSRVIRGGSWYAEKTGVRCAQRYHSHPAFGDAGTGFRVVKLP